MAVTADDESRDHFSPCVFGCWRFDGLLEAQHCPGAGLAPGFLLVLLRRFLVLFHILGLVNPVVVLVPVVGKTLSLGNATYQLLPTMLIPFASAIR